MGINLTLLSRQKKKNFSIVLYLKIIDASVPRDYLSDVYNRFLNQDHMANFFLCIYKQLMFSYGQFTYDSREAIERGGQ